MQWKHWCCLFIVTQWAPFKKKDVAHPLRHCFHNKLLIADLPGYFMFTGYQFFFNVQCYYYLQKPTQHNNTAKQMNEVSGRARLLSTCMVNKRWLQECGFCKWQTWNKNYCILTHIENWREKANLMKCQEALVSYVCIFMH